MKKITFEFVLLLCLFVMGNCKHKSESKMENIELNDGSFIECESLSLSDFEEFKSNAFRGPLKNFKDKFNIDVYLLENNKAVAHDNDNYILFNSLEDVEKVLSDAEQSSEGKEILYNKNPFGKDFPNHVDELAKDLENTLGVSWTEPGELLLAKLDAKLNKIPNASVFKKTHFLNFIAVIGASLIKTHSTSWEMILSSDGRTWNPYLSSNGRPVEFFTYLYEDIYIKQVEYENILTETFKTVRGLRTIK